MNTNTITIEIKLQTTKMLSISSLSKYTSGNYNGLYYIDFGEYPQSSAGVTQPDNTIFNAVSGYYENSETNEKYELKSSVYYKVEPVRWLIIGNGKNLTGLPNLNFDGLAENQLLLLSEKMLVNNQYHTSMLDGLKWKNSSNYLTSLPALKSKIFSDKELSLLGDIFEYSFNDVDYYSKISILSYDMSFLYTNYCSISVSKCNYTPYCTQPRHDYYWLRNVASYWGNYSQGTGSGVVRALNSITGNNGGEAMVYTCANRPIIILQCDIFD